MKGVYATTLSKIDKLEVDVEFLERQQAPALQKTHNQLQQSLFEFLKCSKQDAQEHKTRSKANHHIKDLKYYAATREGRGFKQWESMQEASLDGMH